MLPATIQGCNRVVVQLFATAIAVFGFLRWPGTETRRGKVLRDTSQGIGLVMIEGCQYPFSLGDLWKSAQQPKAGMEVEAEFNHDGQLLAIRTVAGAGQ